MKTKFELNIKGLKVKVDDEFMYIFSEQEELILKVSFDFMKKSFKGLLKLVKLRWNQDKNKRKIVLLFFYL